MPDNNATGRLTAISVNMPHCKIVAYHIYTIYLFSCNNISDIIIPGLLFGSLTGSVASRLSMGNDLTFHQIAKSLPTMLLWSWCHLLFFNLSNQRHSIAEDTANKPWRPLPSHRLTSAQADILFYCMYATIFLVSLSIGGLVPSILIVILSWCYDDMDGASNALSKNIINGVGIGSLFTGPLEVATQHSVLHAWPRAATWVGILMATIATTSHVQDLRDVDGDRKAGRRTLPIAIGDLNARIFGAMGIFGWTWVAGWFWNASWLWIAVATAGGGVMAANMLLYKNRSADTFTWKLFPLWMLGLFIMPVMA
ncbi:UbiA prenyltransferase family-domain-containing protein [Xylariaceae sp. FL1272]|nr:UbiA prenyltransferase family-domain-containing protein [Xylariaceae sp. FL1272]